MGRPEDQPAEPLTMNTLETVMVGGGGIVGIIELSAAGPDRLAWNVAGAASLAIAALGVYLNHRRERSQRNQPVDQTASTTELGSR